MSWNSKTWSWVKKYFSINPASTDGMPVVGQFRTPAVGSRPEKYVYPKSANSNVYNNPYHKRDTRRNYPRIVVYTQMDMAHLLESNAAKASLPLQAAAVEKSVAAVSQKPLVEVLSSQKLYSKQKLAPAPRFGCQYNWKISKDFIPPNDGSYFPMRVFN